jgi:hypothetical protein
MSDDFEDLLKRWLRDRGTADRSAVRALAGHVATLPPRNRRRQPTRLAAAAAVIVALGLAVFAFVPRQGSISAPAAAVPPNPAAFAGDPRLARCGATVETAIDVFEMAHARDYRLHLPAMGLSPELDVDSPGFVVVYRDMQRFPVLGALGGPSEPPRSLAPGDHDVCVLVGADPASAELNVYTDVDITGLTATVISVAASATAGPSGPGPSIRPTDDPSFTAQPAPAWAGDASLSLDCVGAPSTIGPTGSMDIGSSVFSSDAALSDFLDFVATSGLAFPAAGFRQADTAIGARLYTYVVAGQVKAVVVANAEGGLEEGRWFAGSVASCDPSEFDTTRDFGQKLTIWRDAAGRAVSTSVLYERGDCYQATKLTFDDHLYVRDPTGFGYEQAHLQATYDGDVALPANAVRQPYADGSRRLYLAKDGRAVYVVDGRTVERWPHVKGDEYVRMDCN